LTEVVIVGTVLVIMQVNERNARDMAHWLLGDEAR
jgi:hypothetical protein